MTRLFIPPLLLLAAGCGRAAPPAAQSAAPPQPVRTEIARLLPLAETFEAGGTVRAHTTALIASRIMAPVLAVKVNAGDRVRFGQPLVVLDARELRESTARARATALSALQAAAAAHEDEAAADAAARLAAASHARIASLIAKRSATPAELDAAVAGLKEADARRRAAAARRLQADNSVDAAEAAARAAGVAATYAVLSAPFDGIVTERSVESGNLAAPGVPLLTIEDSRRFRIEATVDSSRAALLHVGDSAAVHVEGVRAQPSPATITEIHESVDPVSHSFTIKVALPPLPGLRSGLFGRVTFSAGARPVLSVPDTAIVRRGQLTLVYVDDGGRARLRMVHSGESIAGRVPILAGLAEGDRVIVAPPASLSDGAAVEAAMPGGGAQQ